MSKYKIKYPAWYPGSPLSRPDIASYLTSTGFDGILPSALSEGDEPVLFRMEDPALLAHRLRVRDRRGEETVPLHPVQNNTAFHRPTLLGRGDTKVWLFRPD